MRRSERPRRAGAYIIKSIDGRSQRVAPKHGPRPLVVVTAADRALARAILAYRGQRA